MCDNAIYERKLFIIGNGFDCAHGLETKYKDFYLFLKRDNALYDEQILLEFLMNEIPLYGDDNVIWSNFEECLGEIDFDKCDAELDMIYSEYRTGELTEKDPDYQDYQTLDYLSEEVYTVQTLSTIFARWISTVDVRETTELTEFKELINIENDKFLTFNYTRTLEDIYDVWNPCHIHGYIDEEGVDTGIVVGHGNSKREMYEYTKGDENPLSELSSIDAIEKCKNMIIKMYNAWRKDVKKNLNENVHFFSGLTDVKNIYSYGFSYGQVDLPYIKKIINMLQDSYKVQWLFNDYDEKRNILYEQRVRALGFNGKFGRF